MGILQEQLIWLIKQEKRSIFKSEDKVHIVPRSPEVVTMVVVMDIIVPEVEEQPI